MGVSRNDGHWHLDNLPADMASSVVFLPVPRRLLFDLSRGIIMAHHKRFFGDRIQRGIFELPRWISA